MKARRIDLSPSEFIAGVSGQFSIAEFALYWEICLYIYDKGHAVPDDPTWLARLFRKADLRMVRNAVDGLVAKGKVMRKSEVIDGQLTPILTVTRCEVEIKRSAKRMQDASKSAMKRWHNNELDDAVASETALLTINHQPSTINHQPSSLARADARAADDGLGLGGLAEPADAVPKAGRSAKGTRLPADWEPTAADREFARQWGLEPDRVASEFRDYWCGVAGIRGRKLDWSATYRNRCRQLGKPPPEQRARTPERLFG